MKTNPSEVFILSKIDTLNMTKDSGGASIESVLADIDKQFDMEVINMIKRLERVGVLEQVHRTAPTSYKLTGKYEGASEEVKHYVKHRTIPD